MNTPSKDLIRKVRIGFLSQGTNLSRFCQENNLNQGNVRKALLGDWNGKKGTALRQYIIANAMGKADEQVD